MSPLGLTLANGVVAVVERLDLVLGLVVPEMQPSVRPRRHKPTVVDWVERHTINRVENSVAGLLLLVALESYH